MKLPSWISKRSAGIDGESKLREERPAADEQRIQQAMVDSIKAVSRQRQPSGRPGRFNQAKGIACLDADFHVPDTLPVELQHGLFVYSELGAFRKHRTTRPDRQ